ncbi:MAG TPA: hypothetical protein DCW41_02855 [Clostridiales bacterium]|nr:hypothetical protein [Clostridiales bacterium]
MKKTVKMTMSALLALSVVASAAGCSLFDKAGENCIKVGDEFLEAALERGIEDMIDLCDDEDDADEALSAYAAENEPVDAIISRATFEAGKPECKTKDKKGKVTYTISLPDYEAALDEEPEDVDEFEDLLDDSEDKIEMEITLEFSLNKKDEWVITNPDDFAEDFYQELADVDFPFSSSLVSLVDHTEWWWDDDEGHYTDTSDIELDIIPTAEGQSYDITWEFYYEVYNNGGTNLVYTSPDKTDSGAYIEAYFYASDLPNYDSSWWYMPADTYRIVFYDLNGNVIAENSCVVENTMD